MKVYSSPLMSIFTHPDQSSHSACYGLTRRVNYWFFELVAESLSSVPTLSQNTAKRYEVSTMPTFVFFRNREKLDTVSESCSPIPRLSPRSGNEARELGQAQLAEREHKVK